MRTWAALNKLFNACVGSNSVHPNLAAETLNPNPEPLKPLNPQPSALKILLELQNRIWFWSVAVGSKNDKKNACSPCAWVRPPRSNGYQKLLTPDLGAITTVAGIDLTLCLLDACLLKLRSWSVQQQPTCPEISTKNLPH